MRMTIGERLRRRARGTKAEPDETRQRPPSESDGIPEDISDGVPEPIEPENVLRLADLPSCKTVPVEVAPPDRTGPPRVRGEMIWCHKTAPVLVIEGRPGMSPEEYSANRRR